MFQLCALDHLTVVLSSLLSDFSISCKEEIPFCGIYVGLKKECSKQKAFSYTVYRESTCAEVWY